jgi:hypothetical protein
MRHFHAELDWEAVEGHIQQIADDRERRTVTRLLEEVQGHRGSVLDEPPWPAAVNSGVHLPCDLAGFRNYHAGATILVCGCGPSLNELSEPERFLTIGINDVGRRFQPDYLFTQVGARESFEGDRFRYVEDSHARAIFAAPDLGIIHPRLIPVMPGRVGGTEFSNPDVLPYGYGSSYGALCLAIHMGASRIGLIGVDITDDHFFGATGKHPMVPHLPRIDQQFKDLSEACQERGIEVFNLSPTSRLTAFPRMSLAEFSCAETGSTTRLASFAKTAAGAHSLADIERPSTHQTDSWFFRDVPQFLELAAYAVERNAAPLRLLSAACSTGEEPYSMAIALLDRGLSDFTVDAVDSNMEVIEYAKRGIYPPNSFLESDVPESWLGYFVPNGCGFEPNSEVKRRVEFRQGDLLEPNVLLGPYDVVFCRNVLIYLPDPLEVRHLCSLIAAHLADAGRLFVNIEQVADFLLAGFRATPGCAFLPPDLSERKDYTAMRTTLASQFERYVRRMGGQYSEAAASRPRPCFKPEVDGRIRQTMQEAGGVELGEEQRG